MPSRQDLLALAANTEEIIASCPTPAAYQLEMRDRIIAAAHAAGITDAEIASIRRSAQ